MSSTYFELCSRLGSAAEALKSYARSLPDEVKRNRLLSFEANSWHFIPSETAETMHEIVKNTYDRALPKQAAITGRSTRAYEFAPCME